jgi:hypothetical protein
LTHLPVVALPEGGLVGEKAPPLGEAPRKLTKLTPEAFHDKVVIPTPDPSQT